MTDFMEDYFTDVTYMTVSQGRLSVLFLILTVLAQIAYLVWLTIKVHRLRTLVATLTFQAIPLCKAQNMDDHSTKLSATMCGYQSCLPPLPSLAL